MDTMSSGGIKAVSDRALRAALDGESDTTQTEVAWLDDGQLRRLIHAAKVLMTAAQLELNGRQAGK